MPILMIDTMAWQWLKGHLVYGASSAQWRRAWSAPARGGPCGDWRADAAGVTVVPGLPAVAGAGRGLHAAAAVTSVSRRWTSAIGPGLGPAAGVRRDADVLQQGYGAVGDGADRDLVQQQRGRIVMRDPAPLSALADSWDLAAAIGGHSSKGQR